MFRRSNNVHLFLILIFFLILLSCKEENSVETPHSYVYQIPPNMDDGWNVDHIDNVGINRDKLFELVDLINYNIYTEIHSVLIIKNRKIVFEEYFEGHPFLYNGNNHHGNQTKFTINTIHNQASVTKSFASTLVGIAIDKGYLTIDQKVYDFFPEFDTYRNEAKENMKVRHLLSMSAGFEWNEGEYQYGDSRNDLIMMWNVTDPLKHIMSKPLVSDPGTEFYYNSGCTNILGEIVKRASGFKADTFAKLFLFQPLGISEYSWEQFNNGVLFVSGDLRIRPRDMAKLGFIFLNNGRWENSQVVSKNWVAEASKASIEANSVYKYGYQWWIRTYAINSKNYQSFSARGWGGQVIIVFPENDLIIVLTGGNYTSYEPSEEILQTYIFPSIFY